MDGPVPSDGAWDGIERHGEPRFEGGLQSSFSINDGGAVRVVRCTIESISASSMRIGTTEPAVPGQSIWVDVEGFGPIRALIEDLRDGGFVCQSLLNEPARRRLGVWVAWLSRRNGRTKRDKRVHLRIRAQHSATTVAFEDGEVIAVQLRDVSRSGAALSSEHPVWPGLPVMVGRVPGRVMRTFEGGFAVAFEHILEADEADRLVSGFQVKTTLRRLG